MSSHVDPTGDEPLNEVVLTDGEDTVLVPVPPAGDDSEAPHDHDAETAEIDDAIEALAGQGVADEVASDEIAADEAAAHELVADDAAEELAAQELAQELVAEELDAEEVAAAEASEEADLGDAAFEDRDCRRRSRC